MGQVSDSTETPQASSGDKSDETPSSSPETSDTSSDAQEPSAPPPQPTEVIMETDHSDED